MKDRIATYLNENYSTVTRTMDIALSRTLDARDGSRRVSREDYEDFRGEALLRMLRYSDSCDMSRNPAAWGATIAVNGARDVMRSRASRGCPLSLDEMRETKDGHWERVYDADGGDSASAEAEHGSQVDMLMDYARHCSPLQLRIVELTLQDYLPREIAEVIGISSKRVHEEKCRFISGAKLFFSAEREARPAA